MKLRTFSISREQRKTLFSHAKARKVANEIRTFLYVLLSLPLIAAVTACQKEDEYNNTIFFENVGNHRFYYDTYLDGEYIVLDTGKIPPVKSEYVENQEDESLSHWIADGEWVRVVYLPSNHCLHLYVNFNDSGRTRSAIMYSKDAEPLHIVQRK